MLHAILRPSRNVFLTFFSGPCLRVRPPVCVTLLLGTISCGFSAVHVGRKPLAAVSCRPVLFKCTRSDRKVKNSAGGSSWTSGNPAMPARLVRNQLVPKKSDPIFPDTHELPPSGSTVFAPPPSLSVRPPLLFRNRRLIKNQAGTKQPGKFGTNSVSRNVSGEGVRFSRIPSAWK